MSEPRKPFGPIMQVAYVVDDLQRAIDHWVNNLGIGPFLLLEQLQFSDAHYQGQPLDLRMSAAMSYSGAVQIELIQQLDATPSIFNQRRPTAGAAHHIAALTDDLDAGLDWLATRGANLLQGASIPGGGRVAYLNMGADGAILELAELTAPTLALFDLLRDATEHWDQRQRLMSLPG